MDTNCVGSDPGSAAYYLYDLGKFLHFLKVSLCIGKMEMIPELPLRNVIRNKWINIY